METIESLYRPFNTLRQAIDQASKAARLAARLPDRHNMASAARAATSTISN